MSDSTQSHYLKQWWRLIVNLILANRLNIILIEIHSFIQANAYKHIAWKMAGILLSSQCISSNDGIRTPRKIHDKTHEFFINALWRNMALRQRICFKPWVPIRKADGRLTAKSRVKYRSREIGYYNYCTALRFDCFFFTAPLPRCLSNLERLEKFKPESRGFESSRYLAVRRPPAYP